MGVMDVLGSKVQKQSRRACVPCIPLRLLMHQPHRAPRVQVQRVGAVPPQDAVAAGLVFRPEVAPFTTGPRSSRGPARVHALGVVVGLAAEVAERAAVETAAKRSLGQ